MSKLPTGGYQPTNRPENLIPPKKGPSYRPKEEKTEVIWHPYPDEPVLAENLFLIKVKTGPDRYVELAWIKSVPLTSLEEKGYEVIAWGELSGPYKEEDCDQG